MKPPKQLKIIKKKMQKNGHRNSPTIRTCKKLSLAGAKPLKLTTLTTLSAVFPKAQSSQSRAKMEAKMVPAGTQNHEKSSKRAPQKTLTKKPRKVRPGPHFYAKNRIVFRGFLVPFSTLGPPWGETGPQGPPQSSRDGPRHYFQ